MRSAAQLRLNMGAGFGALLVTKEGDVKQTMIQNVTGANTETWKYDEARCKL